MKSITSNNKTHFSLTLSVNSQSLEYAAPDAFKEWIKTKQAIGMQLENPLCGYVA